MYALIETKNATHIAIHIPSEKAADSLPAIARMLENNAVLIKKGWREMEVVKSSMSIILGDTYDLEDNEGEAIKIVTNGDVIGAEFVAESPDVYRSNQKYREKKEKEAEQYRTEVAGLKLQVEKLQAALAAATAHEEAEAA